MDGFILGVVVGVVINIITALFSRAAALRILPWFLFYIFLHGAYLLATTEWGQQFFMMSKGGPGYFIAGGVMLLVWPLIRYSVDRLDHVTRGKKPLVIEKTFLTIVPFNTGPGLPVPQFLNNFMDRNFRDINDPIHRYPRIAELAKDLVIKGATYDSLQQLQQALDTKKPVSDEERRKFLAEVLQYYIIERIDIYQSDYNAIIAILGSGKVPLHGEGTRPPDFTQYSSEDFLTAISANGLSQFAFIDRFRFSSRGYWVPAGTKITLDNNIPASNELRYVFTLHNPNVYLLSITVQESLFNALTGLLNNYQTTTDINSNLVLCYSFIVKCHFEYYRRTDTDSLEQEQYTHWAESLFALLKKSFTNE